MLRLRQEKHLAWVFGLDVPTVRSLAESVEAHCDELLLHDPAKPEKPRPVLDIRGDFRRAQQRIYKRILLPNLDPSDYSFGGVGGRHIKMNAERHAGSRFVFGCDITDFYPSIHSRRVYDFFAKEQECSPDVAHLLTRLCTYNHHLALGLITSPLLADQFLKPIDKRIAEMAKAMQLIYTRYVDDITLSSFFDLATSGFPGTLKRILQSCGFSTNPEKEQFGRIGDPEVLVTKLRFNRGRLDVSREYLDNLCDRLRDLRSLGHGGEFGGLYYTSGQMWGRVQFVSWVRPRRRQQLWKLYRSVPWKRVREEAQARRLVVCKKTLAPVL